MMSSKLSKPATLRSLHGRLYSSAAAHKTAEGHDGHKKLQAQKLKSTTLPNGLVIATQENYSPIARLGIFVRAGSRYEPPEALGITHCLRNAAGLATQNSTAFGITRNLEEVGAHLSATSSRDHLSYILEVNRDDFADKLSYLADVVTRPAFKPWELVDTLSRTKTDVALVKENPQLQLIEKLHKAAFRGGLANSLFMPKYMIGKHRHADLVQFVKNNFVTNRIAVVGLGVDHDQIIEAIEKKFNFASGAGDVTKHAESKFIGGELRKNNSSDITYAAVVAEGAGLRSQKDALALMLFQQHLGTGPRVRYSTGTSSRLSKAAAKVAEEPFAVSSLNISYADTGVFGVTLAGHAKEMHKLLKAVTSQLRECAKSFSETDLKAAKNALKSGIFMSTESQSNLLEEMGAQAVATGQIFSTGDVEKLIDAITVNDVTSATAKIVKGKGAMSAVGKLYNTPYLEDLA